MMKLEELENQIKRCTKCPELVKSRTQSVLGYGDPRAKVVFIGLAPGKDGADITGVPFTRDPSGVLLQKMLIEIGLSNENNPKNEKPQLKGAFLTNIVKCNPKHWKKSGRPVNRNPTKKEIENCGYYLTEELSMINPKIIAPLGGDSARLVFEKMKIHSEITWNEKMESGGVVIFPMFHPGFVIRGGGRQRYSKQDYKRDFKKLKCVIESV